MLSLLMQILLWPLCLGIIGLILLQGGAGDLSSAFGGGGMLDSTLGVGASKKMAKVTGWMAGTFFIFVLFLAVPHKGGYGSITAPSTSAAPASTVQATVQSDKPVPASSAPVIQAAVAAPSVSAPKLAAPAVEVAKPVVDAGKTVDAAAVEAAKSVEAAKPVVEVPKPVVEAPKPPEVVVPAPAVAAPVAPVAPANK